MNDCGINYTRSGTLSSRFVLQLVLIFQKRLKNYLLKVRYLFDFLSKTYVMLHDIFIINLVFKVLWMLLLSFKCKIMHFQLKESEYNYY